MILLSLDPGLRHSAIAIFDDGALVHAALVKSPCAKERGPTAWVAMATAVCEAFPLLPDVLVLETMKIYRGFRGDPDDMLELQGVTGAVAGMMPATKYVNYLAKTWTGGIPKDVRIERIKATWTPAEEAVVDWPTESLRHNVYDAIGLGRYALRQHEISILSSPEAA